MDTESYLFSSEASRIENISENSDSSVIQLQEDILHQSLEIEKFLKSIENKGENQQSKALKYLFSLFKSELSVNLKLRKLLVQERNESHSIKEVNNKVITAIKKIGVEGIVSIDDIVPTIEELQKGFSKYIEFQKAFRRETKKFRELQTSFQNLENSNQILRADLEMQIATLQAMLDKSSRDNYELEVNYGEMKDKIYTLSNENISLKTEKAAFDQILKSYSNQLSVAEQKVNQQLEKIKNLEYDNQDMQQKIDLLEKEKKDLVLAFQQEKQAFINEKSSFDSKISEMQLQQKGIITQYEQKNSEICEGSIQLRNQIDTFSHRIKLLEEEKTKYSEDICRLGMIEQENLSLKRTIKKYEKKMQKLVSKTNKKIENTLIEKESEIENIRNECHNKILIQNSQFECLEKELKMQLEEQQFENKRLRDQLRKLSYTLQEEESELSRLQTELQNAKYNSPKRKGKTPKKSEYVEDDSV